MKFCLIRRLEKIFPLLLLPLIFSCTDSEQLKNKHLDTAKTYISEANYDKARIELKNVLQIDPKTAEAYSLLGQVEQQRNEWPSALSNYMKAIELDPKILDAQVKLAQYYLSLAHQHKANKNIAEEKKNTDIAQTKINSILHNHPQSIDGKTLQASLFAHQSKTNQATALLQKIIQQKPGTYSAILLLSQIYEHKNNQQQALDTLNAGIKYSPENTLLQQQLAKFYERHKQFDKAIKIMEKVVEKKPDFFAYTVSLAYYYELKNQTEKTEFILRQAIKHNPLEINRHIILSQFLEKRKGLGAAISELNSTIKKHPELTTLGFTVVALYLKDNDTDNAIIQLKTIINAFKFTPEYITANKKLAEIYIADKQINKARPIIKRLLKENPNDNDALILDAKAAFVEHRYATTITNLRLALKSRPNDIGLLQLLSDAYIKTQEIDLAGEVLKKITYLQPENIAAQLNLVRFNIASNQLALALKQINTTLNTTPENLSALKLKTEVLLAKGDVHSAIPVIHKIKKLAPDDAEGWFRMGRIYKLLNKIHLAIEEFTIALDKSPDADGLLAELTDLEIASGKQAHARKRLRQLLLKQPDHPSAHKFIAMTYLSEKSADKARNAFELQLKQHPSDSISYQQLANIELLKNRPEAATNYYLRGLEYLPDDQQLILGLASTYERLQQYEDAINAYKDILNKNANNAVAINNLAMILVNKKTDKESYALAEKLVAGFKFSNQAILLDTYGWVNYHTENYKQAISAINKAISLSPEIPVLYYHLGMVYIETGNINLAIKNLESALNKGEFPGMKVAKKTLASIKH
jgi:tetratricopeptide (TPR) repeat protein